MVQSPCTNGSVITLNGNNNFNAATNFYNCYNAGSGNTEILRLGSDSALGTVTNPTNTGVTMDNRATLDINGHTVTVRSLCMPYTTNEVKLGTGGSLTVYGNGNATDTGAQSTSINGFISGAGSTTWNLVNTGRKVQILANNNTYSGTTTITAGTLALSNTSSTNNIASSSAIDVQNGATLRVTSMGSSLGLSGGAITLANSQKLMGTGTVTGGVTVASGTHLAPGETGSIGALAVSGNLALSGNYDVRLGAPGTSDRTNVTGTATLGGILNLTDAGGAAAGQYTILTQSGTASGSFATVNNVAGLHYKVDAGTSGSVYVDEYRLASATNTPTLNFANYHVNDAVTQQNVSVTNSATNDTWSEKLDASLSAGSGITTAGAVSLLAAGSTDNSHLLVGIDTSSVGAKAGTVTVNLNSNGSGTSGYGTSALSSQSVSVTGGNVYRLASASNNGPVAVGNWFTGSTPTAQTVTVTNSAANDSWSENLNASIAGSGGVTASGSATGIGAGANSGSSLTVAIDTALAGSKNGTAALTLASNGAGTSGLGTTGLAGQNVSVTGSVFDHASGSFSNSSVLDSLTINFGKKNLNEVVGAQSYSIYNLLATAGFTNALDLFSVSAGTGDVTKLTTNASTLPLFTDLVADSSNPFTASFNTSSAGDFSAQYILHVQDSAGVNGGGTGRDLTLTLQGSVVPEPGTLALLAAGLIGLLAYAWRKRK